MKLHKMLSNIKIQKIKFFKSLIYQRIKEILTHYTSFFPIENESNKIFVPDSEADRLTNERQAVLYTASFLLFKHSIKAFPNSWSSSRQHPSLLPDKPEILLYNSTLLFIKFRLKSTIFSITT